MLSVVMASWPTVPAKMERVQLESGGSRSFTQSVLVQYSYTVNGKEYFGKRASLYNGDNIGDFHKDLYQELKSCADHGQAYPVHVNPNDPADSIVNTTFRLGIIGLMVTFGSLFAAVGARHVSREAGRTFSGAFIGSLRVG